MIPISSFKLVILNLILNPGSITSVCECIVFLFSSNVDSSNVSFEFNSAEVDENITPKLLNEIGMDTAHHDRAKIYRGKGCEKCGHSGYKGRMGIYEILLVDRDLKNGILQNLTQTRT